MKFINLMLLLGTILILSPILHHGFYLYEYAQLAALQNNLGRVTLPEEPLIWYITAASVGGILVLLSVVVWLGKIISKEDATPEPHETKPAEKGVR